MTHVEQRRTILLVLDTAVQLIESKINFMIQISSASSPDVPLIYTSLETTNLNIFAYAVCFTPSLVSRLIFFLSLHYRLLYLFA